MKPNYKKLAKNYRLMYNKMRGYFIDIRNEFEKCQRDRNEYMICYRNAIDEIDRLKLKVEDLTSENKNLKVKLLEFVELTQAEFCVPLKGDNNEQSKED